MNYISIKQVLDNILAHPLLQDLSLERAVNYAIRFIRIVGCPVLFEDKVATVTINNYRGMLPCDCTKVVQVRLIDNNFYNGKSKAFRYSTDSFQDNRDETYQERTFIDNTYKIRGNIIHTTVREGTLEIAYQALPLDKDNYPLLFNNESFIRALELYIKKEWFTVLFDTGKITPAVLQNTQQEYGFAVKQCQSELVKPTIDQMESITNMWNTLIPRTKEHDNGFKTLGTREILKIK
jgi:hypothetical protein